MLSSFLYSNNFNPQGSREPRRMIFLIRIVAWIFQSTRLSRASTTQDRRLRWNGKFQSTRLSRASTRCIAPHQHLSRISIHKALASLDEKLFAHSPHICDFNPQGSREPRPPPCNTEMQHEIFQSTRLSRASTPFLPLLINASLFQSTRLSRASTSANGQAN